MTSYRETSAFLLIEERMKEWAAGAQDVRGIVVYGSRALPDGGSDSYSDLDLVLFTVRPGGYAESSGWLRDIGEIWLAALDTTAAGDLEWFALFRGGLKVDIILAHADPSASFTSLVESSPYSVAFDRGIRAIYQESGDSPTPILTAKSKKPSYLTQEPDIKQNIDLALMRIVKSTMLFCRRDMDRCRSTLQEGVSRQLQTIVNSSSTLMKHTDSRDRHQEPIGTKLALSEIEGLINSSQENDLESLRSAITKAIDLVRQLAVELSVERGHRLPDAGQKKTIGWLLKLLDV